MGKIEVEGALEETILIHFALVLLSIDKEKKAVTYKSTSEYRYAVYTYDFIIAAY